MAEQLPKEKKLPPDQQAFLDARNDLLDSLHEWQNAGAPTVEVRDAIDRLVLARLEHRHKPYRIRTFWSPDRALLITVYVTEDDITLMDDNGDIFEPTGPEQDVAKETP